MNLNNDLEKLIENLPFFIRGHLNQHIHKEQLIEIVLDLGRRPEARFVTGPEYLSQKIISWQDIDYMTKRISKFSNDNRAGIERTLHRISCIRNRQFLINGLTCRVGRAVFGTISVVRDLLESEKSILILGKPGVGKTTIIREIARVLADEMEKRVIIIDTSNEIAGESDIPHSGIGRARRMQVAKQNYNIKL
jgi:stage III sporulation protein SpoIIIAA